MSTEIQGLIVSECCGTRVHAQDGDDYGICMGCKEHCGVVSEHE